MRNKFEKQNPNDTIWWLVNPEKRGEMVFSFDKRKLFNLFKDYPDNLSAKEKAIFDRENPFWVSFFTGEGYEPIKR